MNFDGVEKIAAALLYEGYILYPYRATAIKNRQRWNFGTLYPRAYAQAQRPQEPFRLIAECLAVADARARFEIRIRFLQMVRRWQGSPVDAPQESRCLTDPSLGWDEAVERIWERRELRLSDLMTSPLTFALRMEGTILPVERGVGQIPELRATLTVSAKTLPSGGSKIRVEFENATELPGGANARRENALPQSLVSAHVLLGLTGGEFVSLLDPGEMYRESVAACCSVGVFPVLAGEAPDRSVMLCSPIILYDYPKVAAESAGDFFDGTEMDEMLTLRVLTLTDAEKQEMREDDPRGRQILERTEALTAESMLKAHGVIRAMREI